MALQPQGRETVLLAKNRSQGNQQTGPVVGYPCQSDKKPVSGAHQLPTAAGQNDSRTLRRRKSHIPAPQQSTCSTCIHANMMGEGKMSKGSSNREYLGQV